MLSRVIFFGSANVMYSKLSSLQFTVSLGRCHKTVSVEPSLGASRAARIVGSTLGSATLTSRAHHLRRLMAQNRISGTVPPDLLSCPQLVALSALLAMQSD